MKPWEQKIVPVGLTAAGLVSLFVAVRPAFAGGSLDVVFFLLGVVCIILGVVAWRKSRSAAGA